MSARAMAQGRPDGWMVGVMPASWVEASVVSTVGASVVSLRVEVLVGSVLAEAERDKEVVRGEVMGEGACRKEFPERAFSGKDKFREMDGSVAF